MKPLLLFFTKLIIIASSFFILITVVVMPQYSTEYSAALRDKFARAKAIDQPKIILVGGSNVAFGFDSKMLEKEMAMPVVNFGLHASLGQEFHSDLLKGQIKRGDIIILAPEYYDYLEDYCDYVMAWVAIENDFSLFIAAARERHLDGLLDAFPTYLRRAMDHFFDNLNGRALINELSRENFNDFGDYAVPRPELIIEAGMTNSFVSASLSDSLRDYWNDLDQFVIGKKATLYMSSPPIVFEEVRVDLDALQTQLEENLNFPVISKLADYVYPMDYFYDTGFHLNDHGRKIRTEQLIKDLKSLSFVIF